MTPGPRACRPATAPAYYLGRPASWWIASAAASRRVQVVDPDGAYRQALSAGLIVHRANPLNAETPLPALTGTVVPGDRFFPRSGRGR
jgi:hypothetical protein